MTNRWMPGDAVCVCVWGGGGGGGRGYQCSMLLLHTLTMRGNHVASLVKS